MQIFNYVVKDQNGKSLKGKVEANSQSQAVEILRNKQLVVISLKTQQEDQAFAFLKERFGHIKNEDIVAFTRQMATMINAGLPITEALSILQAQAKPQMAKVIDEVSRDIQGGSALGDALNEHPDVFSQVYVSLVRAGEASGKLDEIMNRLADTEEKQRNFRAKVKGALIYPVIVLIAMVAVIFVMMVFVVPKLTVMYEDFDADLPLTTQLLITFSDFMQQFWWLFIAMVGGGVYGLRLWRKTPAGEKQVDELMLNVPIFGPLRKEVMVATIARTLSLLVGSGISILEALEIVKATTQSVVFEEALAEASKGVEKGLPLAVMLARQQLFPPLLPQMISVGEETGELDAVLLKVAVYFENESAHKVRNLTTAMEPVIMIVLGIGVGFLVIAIIMPLYNLTSQF